MRPGLVILPSPGAVSAAAAAEIARSLAAAIDARGIAHWATTGGSAAPPLYRALREPILRESVAWRHVRVWWGDDRFVPPDHPLSNVLPLTETFLAAGGPRIPSAHVHPVPVAAALARGGGPEWAAAAYEAELRASGPPGDAAGTPVFDLVVLGVGPDGHVLSVFPHATAWDEPALCVAVPAPDHVEPHVPRVTLHPRVLAAARRVLVVSTGASKAEVLARAWGGDDVRELPVRATFLPTATWLLDEAAAAGLPRA